MKQAALLAREAVTPKYVRAVGTLIMAAVRGTEPLHHIYEDGYLD